MRKIVTTFLGILISLIVIGYFVSLVLAVISSLAGFMESRADVAFLAMNGAAWVARENIFSGVGHNPYWGEYDFISPTDIFMWALPISSILVVVAVLVFGHALLIAGPAATLIIALGFVFGRIERRYYPV